MKKTSKISVIIPVYNAETYLSECLDSVISQTYRDLEIILINDGSSDRSPEICREYAEKDERIVLITQKNAGEAAARNRGLEAAAGEYILFVDADDLLAQDICELATEGIQDSDVLIFDYDQGENPEHFLCMQREAVSAAELGYCENDAWLRSLLGPEKTVSVEASLNTAWGKLYRHEFLEKHRIRCDMGVVIGADLLLNLKVFLWGPVVRYLPVRGYFYRYNPASVVHRYNPGIRKSYQLLHEAISRTLGESNRKEQLKHETDYQKVYGLLQIFSRDIFHPDNPKSERDRKADFQELVTQEECRLIIPEQRKNYDIGKRLALIFAENMLYYPLKVMYLLKDCRNK